MIQLPPKTWFIIPAFNAAERLGAVLAELNTATGNIVVVNDGSVDKTAEICRDFRCFSINHPYNMGQGAALQTGTDFALSQGAQILIHFDADGQMQLKDVPAMIEPLRIGLAEVTLGSRYLSKTNQVPGLKRWLIHRPAILLQNALARVKLTDAHCGFRALSREAAQKCIFRQNRMAHATEIIFLISRHGLRYQEVPVDILYHHYGQKLKDGLAVLKDLLFTKLADKT